MDSTLLHPAATATTSNDTAALTPVADTQYCDNQHAAAAGDDDDDNGSMCSS